MYFNLSGFTEISLWDRPTYPGKSDRSKDPAPALNSVRSNRNKKVCHHRVWVKILLIGLGCTNLVGVSNSLKSPVNKRVSVRDPYLLAMLHHPNLIISGFFLSVFGRKPSETNVNQQQMSYCRYNLIRLRSYITSNLSHLTSSRVPIF